MLSCCCIKLHPAAGCLAGPWMLTRAALCLTLTQALRTSVESIHKTHRSCVFNSRTLRIRQPAQRIAEAAGNLDFVVTGTASRRDRKTVSGHARRISDPAAATTEMQLRRLLSVFSV